MEGLNTDANESPLIFQLAFLLGEKITLSLLNPLNIFEMIIDEYEIAQQKSKWKHFTYFLLAEFIIDFIAIWFFSSGEMYSWKMNLSLPMSFLIPILLTIAMIRTYKSTVRLRFIEKAIPATLLVLIQCIDIFVWNAFRIFTETLTVNAFIEGTKVVAIYRLVFFIPACILTTAITKSKITDNK